MCGIAGMFNRDGRPVDADLLVEMTRTLVHRGPDEEGYYLNRAVDGLAERALAPFSGSYGSGNVGLGHRRLSIIDLASGQQPLSNEDGTVWVSFNGEIYNFETLHAELEAKGHRFRTRCDTETIVHAYEEWGERCVERFRGMFAFAVWDDNRRQLYLARDRVGKKPLYYLLDADRFIFGSEMKAILRAPGVPREIDPTALSDFLSLLYVPSPKSILSAVKKLPAAHYAVVTADTFRSQPYWDLPFRPISDESEELVIEGILSGIEEATRIRMISEVPLGAFLSGGVDSSAVVAMMAKSSTEPVVTNAISFSVAKYDEAVHARRVADLFATNHHEYHVTPEAIPVIEQLAWHYDEPFADSSAVPTYYVSKTARERVTVSLSGDGGDESFAGYRRYSFDMFENRVRNLVPRALGRPLFSLLGSLYPKADYLPQVFRGKAFISNLARDPVDAYFYSVSAFKEETKAALLAPEVSETLGGYRTQDWFREIYDRAPADDHLSRLQYLDIKTYLCEDILTKVDRASMAVSLEVRCPLLDHVVLERVARIPWQMKLVGTNGKHVFKRALKRHLPDDILYRRKMGFGVPIVEWLRTACREYAAARILEGEGSRRYFSRDRLDKMWKDHQRGVRNWSTELWIVLMFNLWHERFATNVGAEPRPRA
ncbi:MAG TPA: asparagine synthase (glutamine-hydrolyzing) [Candidatus Polarisedimenticolaceae bacterium]|nr:asparagine synthase (glutamine-hydrolyzing) [Candidatus Polarisedimenticolaceae bacterium]